MPHYFNEAVEKICESIRFDSSAAQHTAKMPFGKGAYDCLNHFLTLAEELGFETHNYDGYVGEVVFGQGEPFAILCHLDVVPAGTAGRKIPSAGSFRTERSGDAVPWTTRAPRSACSMR